MRIKDTVPYDLVNSSKKCEISHVHKIWYATTCNLQHSSTLVESAVVIFLLSLHCCKSQQCCAIDVLTCKLVFMFFHCLCYYYRVPSNCQHSRHLFNFPAFHESATHHFIGDRVLIQFSNAAFGWSVSCDPALGLLWPWIQHRSEQWRNRQNTNGWYNSWLKASNRTKMKRDSLPLHFAVLGFVVDWNLNLHEQQTNMHICG